MSEEKRKLIERNIVYEDTLVEITPELMKKTILEQDKEIERLKEENKKYNKWVESLNKDNHRLNNIINEALNYIEKEYVQVENKEYNLDWNNLEYIIKEILEILDKGSDEISK